MALVASAAWVDKTLRPRLLARIAAHGIAERHSKCAALLSEVMSPWGADPIPITSWFVRGAPITALKTSRWDESPISAPGTGARC